MKVTSAAGYITEKQKAKLDQIDAQNKTSKLKKSQNMGRDQFLNILMTQLSNQNPLNPLEDKDFIAQMAQFSSVESMSSMANNFEAVKNDIKDLKDVIKADTPGKNELSQRELLEAISKKMDKLNESQIEKLNEMIKTFKAGGSYGA